MAFYQVMDPSLGLSHRQQIARDIAAAKARRLLRAAWYDEKQRANAPPSITDPATSHRAGPASLPPRPLHATARPPATAAAPTATSISAVLAPLPPPPPAMRHSGHAHQQHVVPRGPAATKQKQGAHHSRHSPRTSVAPSYAPRRLLVRASQTARPADDGTREREVSVQDTVPNTPRDDAAEQNTKKPQKSTRTPPTPPPRAVQNSAAQFHHGPECAENNRATMTAPLKGRADGRVNPLPSPQLQRYPLRSRPATGIIPVMSDTAIGAELLHPQLAGRAMERAPGAHNDNEEPDLAVPTAQKQTDQRRSDLEYNNKDDMNAENGNGASRGLQLPGRNSQGRAAPTKTVLDIDDNEKPGFLPNAVRENKHCAHCSMAVISTRVGPSTRSLPLVVQTRLGPCSSAHISLSRPTPPT